MLAFVLAAAVAAAGAAEPVQAPELWRGSHVGMTLAEVQALFPTGHGAAPTLVSGGAAVWAVDETVFGRDALATYYFAGGRLLEVVVSVKGLHLRHTRDNVDDARDLRQALARYYGPPKVCVDADRRGLARLDCRWVTPTIQVGLSYVDYGGLAPSLDVAVRALPGRVREHGAVFRQHGSL
jgi:hypothetical protein